MPESANELVWGATVRTELRETSRFTYGGEQYTYVLNVSGYDEPYGIIQNLSGNIADVWEDDRDMPVSAWVTHLGQRSFENLDGAIVWLIENQPV